MDRVIALEGGRNFRDLGGYETHDGRRVKWRTLFRSGSMAGLTPADYQRLDGFGIKQVCDFRTSVEREAEPNRWCEAANIPYWSRDYEMSFGELRQLFSLTNLSVDQMRFAMVSGYHELPFEQAPAYKALFERLTQGHIPLVFNCSAGKDRAGTGAALVLSALGVPRETVIEDYLLTNQVLDINKMLSQRAIAQSALTKHGMEIAAAVLHTDRSYIEAAFETIEARHGGIEPYLDEVLGVAPRALIDMRDHLLE